MSDELYKKHRPTKFEDVVGQSEAIDSLKSMAKSGHFPHTILFVGESGCGKTTLARIIKDKLKCGAADFREVNAADDRGIDLPREIRSRSGLRPISGPVRVWLIDEVHQLTTQAQDAFLKILEDTPKHVYFLLCTTDPQKLKKTIITRCTQVKVRPLNHKEASSLISTVAAREGVEIPTEVVDKIVEVGEGSPRKLLVLLNQVLNMTDTDAMVDCIVKSDTQREAFELCKALLAKSRSWSSIAAILRELKADPESVRWMVLGYMNKVALSAGAQSERAVVIIEAFMEPFYESKAAGLTQACYVAHKS